MGAWVQPCMLILVLACMLSAQVAASNRIYHATAARDPSKLNIHLIPHTHNDPGWLHTYTEYFRGWTIPPGLLSTSTTVAEGVDEILNSVVSSLLMAPERTFAYADMAFFVKWWQEQTPTVRGLVKQLVASKQLEFVNGGLVQHDEATSHYSAIVEQMGLGMRFLYEELGAEPRVGWMLDDFGHSRAEPLLRSMGGFDALFMTRTSQADLDLRKKRRAAEFVWRGSPAYGSASDLFVSQSPNGIYSIPYEHHWTIAEPPYDNQNPDATLLLDDGSSQSWDASTNKTRVQVFLDEFYKVVEEWEAAIPETQQDIFIYMGVDFAYRQAPNWFRAIDKIIHHVNQDGRYNAFYSTPERFLQSKWQHAQSQLNNAPVTHSRTTASGFLADGAASARRGRTQGAVNGTGTSRGRTQGAVNGTGNSTLWWALKEDDLFPYHSPSGMFSGSWTGYFTTRPTIKGMIRQASAVLRATRQLEVITGLPPSTFNVATSKGKGVPDTDASAAAAAANVTANVTDHHMTLAPAKAFEDSQEAAGPDAAVLEFAVALAHHHDAITGTHKHHVGQDYIHWLHVGMQKAVPKMLLCLQQLVFGAKAGPHPASHSVTQADKEPPLSEDTAATGNKQQPAADVITTDTDLSNVAARAAGSAASVQPQQLPKMSYCLLLNASLCSSSVQLTATQGGGFLLTVYNSLSWPLAWQGIRVPVTAGQSYTVTGPGGARVRSELLHVPASTVDFVWQAPYLQGVAASHSNVSLLAFQVTVPALGHAVYRVQQQQSASTTTQAEDAPTGPEAMPHGQGITMSSPSPNGLVTLSTGALDVVVDPRAAGITQVTVVATRRRFSYSHSLVQYASLAGSSQSGAYLFTLGTHDEVSIGDPAVEIHYGALVTEVRQTWSELNSTVITRLWAGSEVLEVEWTAAPPPVANEGYINWELFIRYNTDIASGGVWYTDANGLEWQQRQLGYQPSYPANSTALATNLYPMTTGALVKEGGSTTLGRRLYISTDRAQGVTSLHDGQLDILLHRVSGQDDGKGMDERLIDDSVAVGRHVVWFSDAQWPANSSSNSGSSTTGSAAKPHASQKQLHARHYQQMLVDPLQLAFSPVPPAGVAYNEVSSFLGQTDSAQQQPLHKRAGALQTKGVLTSTSSHTVWNSAPAGSNSSSADATSALAGMASLPPNLHILSLKWMSCNSILLRLVHIAQAGEVTSGNFANPSLVHSLWHLFMGQRQHSPGTTKDRRWRSLRRQKLSSTSSAADSVDTLWLPNGVIVTDIREVTLFGGQRPLTADDLEPGRVWPLGRSLTSWQPKLWPSPPAEGAGAASGDAAAVAAAAAGATTAASAQVASSSYSFFSNRIVGPVGHDAPVTLMPMQIRAFLLTVKPSTHRPHNCIGSRSGGSSSSSGSVSSTLWNPVAVDYEDVVQRSTKGSGAANTQHQMATVDWLLGFATRPLVMLFAALVLVACGVGLAAKYNRAGGVPRQVSHSGLAFTPVPVHYRD